MNSKHLEEVEFQLKKAAYWADPTMQAEDFEADEKCRAHIWSAISATKELRRMFETSQIDLLKDLLQELELKASCLDARLRNEMGGS